MTICVFTAYCPSPKSYAAIRVAELLSEFTECELVTADQCKRSVSEIWDQRVVRTIDECFYAVTSKCTTAVFFSDVTWPAVMQLKAQKIKVVNVIDWAKPRNERYRTITESDTVVCQNVYTSCLLKDVWNIKGIRYIPWSPGCLHVAEKLNRDKRIVGVYLPEAPSGLSLFAGIEMVNRLASRHRDSATFIPIARRSTSSGLRRLAKKYGFDVLAPRSLETLYETLAGCDLLVTIGGGSSIVYGMSLAAAVPIIAVDDEVGAEYLTHRSNALVVANTRKPLDNLIELERVVDKALGQKNTIKKLGKKCQPIAECREKLMRSGWLELVNGL